MRVVDVLRLCRLLLFGVPFLVVFLVGLAVAIADDLLDWPWLHRLDLWIMEWANQLQEAMR